MIDIEVFFTLHVDEKNLPKLGKAAEELGLGYGDPGKKELVRRLAVNGGLEAVRDVLPGFNEYTEK